MLRGLAQPPFLCNTISIKAKPPPMAQHIDVSGLSWAVAEMWAGRNLATDNFGEGKLAFVVDTGVELSADLNVNQELSRNFMRYESDPHNDKHNHGTAAAKLIGAKVDSGNNFGVAPGTEIVSLKVFDKDENDIEQIGDIAGAIDYAAQYIVDNNLQGESVINLSLGGGGVGARQGRYHDIVIAWADKGVRFSISAGNHNGPVDNVQPGNAGYHPNVYTAAAHDVNGKSTWFTGYGDAVDYSAPGGGVPVLMEDGFKFYHSGTSFSAPLLGGLVLTGGFSAVGKTTTTSGEEYKIEDKVAMTDSPLLNKAFVLKQSNSTFIGSNYKDRVIAGGWYRDAVKNNSYGPVGIDISTGLGDDALRIRRGEVTADMGDGNDIIIGSKRRNSFARVSGGEGEDTFNVYRRGHMVIEDYNAAMDTIVTHLPDSAISRLVTSYGDDLTTVSLRNGRTILEVYGDEFVI